MHALALEENLSLMLIDNFYMKENIGTFILVPLHLVDNEMMYNLPQVFNK